MNKVIVRLKGGLGNQLFQFAIGKQLSILNNCKLKLDISSYNHYTLHDYGLNHFNIAENIATKSEVPLQYSTGNRYLRKLFKLIDPLHQNITIVKEKSLCFDNKIFNLNNELLYLDGHWQSEKYFISITNIIRENLRLKDKITDRYLLSIINKIKKTNSLSIHIRRGDFTLPETSKVHGLTSMEFFEKAINYLIKRIDSVEFFIFSDDDQWIRNNLSSLPNSTIIEGTNEKNYIDLFLMSQCKHNIISNSTFSWWGAWLNPNPKKIVVAPKKWYNIESMNNNTNDLIPNNWIRL